MTASPSEAPPYLSLVVTSRNDDHGLNIMQRMQFFVDGWFHQARRFGLPSELIFVEWNPPPDRPRLFEALRWPAERGPCRLRILEVPESIHARYRVGDKLPLIQFTAKNAGIRRARGTFVLATNIDILFSDEMMAFLAKQALDPACLYRNDRIDVPTDLPTDRPIGAVLAYAAQNPIRINGRHWTFDLRDSSLYAISTSRAAFTALQLVKLLKEGSRQLPAALAALGLAARIMLTASDESAARRRRLAGDLLATVGRQWRHEFAQFAEKRRTEIARRKRRITGHTNACGDFQLMAREKWFALQGYPEYDGFSMHLDSLLQLGALASGLVREEILPFPLRHFHIEHSAGSGFTPEGEFKMYERIARKGIPFLLWEEVEDIAAGLRDVGSGVAFNDARWGLANDELLETVLPATWDAP
ncbi:MAG: hypothetical protein IT565_03070 [Rhodospirillales bacterium]|nr:hypothetical protein [Rhodospirillales bacterium]